MPRDPKVVINEHFKPREPHGSYWSILFFIGLALAVTLAFTVCDWYMRLPNKTQSCQLYCAEVK